MPQAVELFKVYINHDHRMTLTFLWQGQLRSPMHLNKKNRKMPLNGEIVLGIRNGQKNYVYGPRGLSAPAPELYTCI